MAKKKTEEDITKRVYKKIKKATPEADVDTEVEVKRDHGKGKEGFADLVLYNDGTPVAMEAEFESRSSNGRDAIAKVNAQPTEEGKTGTIKSVLSVQIPDKLATATPSEIDKSSYKTRSYTKDKQGKTQRAPKRGWKTVTGIEGLRKELGDMPQDEAESAPKDK